MRSGGFDGGRPGSPAEARISPPHIREGAVPRADVLHRLRPTARSSVALIIAPGGYGKTTILAALPTQAAGRPFAWVTVEAGDNDPAVFVRCVIAALQRVGAIDAARLRVKAGDSHAVLVARLAKALKSVAPLAIAIDDIHLLTSVRSRKIVETLANSLPDGSQLLLAGRMLPRLSLTRLRADGRLIELGTDDLRLSDDEAEHLLRAAGVDGPAEELDALLARAEGWPAGLYLAALACADGDPPIGAFDGTDRFVTDYFSAECLASLDADDREFLTRIAPLEELSGPFCDAVLRTTGSAARLDRIARVNLFVMGLGSGSARVYRLHPMLRDALAAELENREPGQAFALASRAADWSVRHGDLELAAEYAWAAGDRDRFASIVEDSALLLFHGGELALVEHWLARADDELLARHPAVAIFGAFMHNIAGRPDQADAWAAIAERASDDVSMPGDSPSVDAWLAALRAAMCRSGQEAMRLDAAHALAGLAEGSPWRPTSLMLLGVGQLLAGVTIAADEILAEAHLAGTTAGTAGPVTIALAERSLLAAAEGRWEAAEWLSAQAREVLHGHDLTDYPNSPLTYVASARSAVHHSDWIRARNDLEHARACLPARAPEWFAVQVHLEAARARLGLSERGAAATELAAAEQILERAPDLGVLAGQAAALRTELEQTTLSNGSRSQLTRAELRLLPLLTTHLTFREIGELLGISRNTVKTQAICTYRKLGVTSRSEAINRAIELGLVERPDALDVAAR